VATMEIKEYFIMDGLFNLSKELENILNFENTWLLLGGHSEPATHQCTIKDG
jgi:hypothetical protein